MDEKATPRASPPPSALPRTEYGAIVMKQEVVRPHRRRHIIRTYVFLIIWIALLNTYIFPYLSKHLPPLFRSRHGSDNSNDPSSDVPTAASNASLVPLEAHIMSKCPDARDCLVDLVVPAMEKIVDKVDFRLSYIGSIDDGGYVECMHGPEECLGNMLGLCADQLFPNNAKRSLGFSNCMTMKYEEIAKRDLVEGCSLEHGISFDELNGCISDEGRGTQLLEKSVKRSQDAGVRKSCTVRLAGEIWCVRDGGEWKGCENGHDPKDLVDAVDKIYEKNVKKE